MTATTPKTRVQRYREAKLAHEQAMRVLAGFAKDLPDRQLAARLTDFKNGIRMNGQHVSRAPLRGWTPRGDCLHRFNPSDLPNPELLVPAIRAFTQADDAFREVEADLTRGDMIELGLIPRPDRSDWL